LKLFKGWELATELLRKQEDGTMGKLVTKFDKNSTEEVHVQITEYKGHNLIDIRVFYYPEGEEEARPTKKGISISTDLFPDLKKAILELEKALSEEGLLDKASE
jgi:hypothetical protein